MVGRHALRGIGVFIFALFALGLTRLDVPAAHGSDHRSIRGRVTLSAGVVRFAGQPPALSTIDMSADPYCRDQHDTPVMQGPIRVGTGGGLRDVLVRVTNAPANTESPTEEALLDQEGCLYTPGVVVVRVDQPLTIRNSDATLHNVRVEGESNPGFNIGQPLRGVQSERTFEEQEVGVAVRCDIHGWMNAVIHVVETDFFDVSGEDGSFSLPPLPAGDYQIEAWHPTLGASTQSVTVVPGSDPQITFEFSAS